jgi:hypothetical protein
MGTAPDPTASTGQNRRFENNRAPSKTLLHDVSKLVAQDRRAETVGVLKR